MSEPPILATVLPAPATAGMTASSWEREWNTRYRRWRSLDKVLHEASRVNWVDFERWWEQRQACRFWLSIGHCAMDVSTLRQEPRWHRVIERAERQHQLGLKLLDTGRWRDWLERQIKPGQPRQVWAREALSSLPKSPIDTAGERASRRRVGTLAGAASLRENALARPSRRTLLHCQSWREFSGNDPEEMREIRRRARDRGLSGVMLLPSDAITNDISTQLKDGSRRAMLWQHAMMNPHPEEAIQEMLDARQSWANAFGSQSWGQQMMKLAAIRDASALGRVLDEGLAKTGRALEKMYNRMRPVAQAYSTTELTSDPWDRGFTQTFGRVHISLWEYRPLPAMSMDVALPKAVSEMMTAGDWVMTAWQAGKDGWGARFRHAQTQEERTLSILHQPDGRPPGSWYALDVPPSHAIIHTNWRPSQTHAAWEEMRLMAHELGHVLHAWSFASQSADDPMEQVAQDFSEFPSQLMERWVFDPQALARWSDPSVPAWQRKADYWKSHLLRVNTDEAFCMEHSLAETIVDFRLHQRIDPTVADWREDHQAVHEVLGKPVTLVSGRPPSSFFRWDNYAGMQYQYHVGRCAIARVLPSAQRATSRSAEVRQVMQGFLKHLGPLSQGRPERFSDNWRTWRNESPLQSVSLGQSRMIESWLRRVQPTISKPHRPEGRWRLR